MMTGMTLQQALHIVREEAVRCRRIAGDLADGPMDMDGRCVGWAREYREKAEAMEIVAGAAQMQADYLAKVVSG